MAVPNIGEVAASAMQNYRNKFTDNVFKNHVTLNHLKNTGGVEKKDGGRELVVPLMHATNTTVMAYDHLDELDLTYQDTLDAAVYDWKHYNASVVISRTDMLKNKGKSMVLSLLKAKIKQAELSLAERLNSDLFDGASSNTKEITGLETIVAATGEVGSISGTSYEFWRSYVDDASEALAIADMRTAKNTANNGGGGSKVSMIVTTQTLMEKYHALLTASYQMNQPVSGEGKRLGDAGFTGVEFEGIPMRYDEQCTSGAMYFINSENLKLYVNSDDYFEVINKSEPAAQHVSVQHISLTGELGTDRRASLSKLINKTA